MYGSGTTVVDARGSLNIESDVVAATPAFSMGWGRTLENFGTITAEDTDTIASSQGTAVIGNFSTFRARGAVTFTDTFDWGGGTLTSTGGTGTTRLAPGAVGFLFDDSPKAGIGAPVASNRTLNVSANAELILMDGVQLTTTGGFTVNNAGT